ncbi:hypothetical protein EVAR_66198_1 [Eumeta japonica]|uniref:Uncharacterized protein n=1 Tax=Eumeta variegata TaxID=151549 RepID=A0A4C1ZN01_EUMVA|nr:hypothetical protein EVAR_66198_1 [Eumeta japonica]
MITTMEEIDAAIGLVDHIKASSRKLPPVRNGGARVEHLYQNITPNSKQLLRPQSFRWTRLRSASDRVSELNTSGRTGRKGVNVGGSSSKFLGETEIEDGTVNRIVAYRVTGRCETRMTSVCGRTRRAGAFGTENRAADRLSATKLRGVAIKGRRVICLLAQASPTNLSTQIHDCPPTEMPRNSPSGGRPVLVSRADSPETSRNNGNPTEPRSSFVPQTRGTVRRRESIKLSYERGHFFFHRGDFVQPRPID